MTLNPEDPLRLEFLMDTGLADIRDQALAQESQRLVHYFMAALTVPEEELWVNLSPHEKDRIMADGISRTEMGRDLLEQDYLLKQLTAFLLIPDSETGEAFWEQMRAQWDKTGSTEEMPTDLHSRVWIMPESVRVYLQDRTVMVSDARLKVMLEEDYLTAEVNRGRDNHGLGLTGKTLRPLSTEQTRLMREMILPLIQQEVNEGPTFIRLRQIYNAMVLAVWYKNNLPHSALNQAYADRNRVQGIDPIDPQEKQQLHARYLKAFQDGLYGTIQEEYDPTQMAIVSRRYVSGGFDAAQLSGNLSLEQGDSATIEQRFRNLVTVDAAMTTSSRVRNYVEGFLASYQKQMGRLEGNLLWAAEQIEDFSFELREWGMSPSEIASTRERVFDALVTDRSRLLKEKITEYQQKHPDSTQAEVVKQTLFDHSRILGLSGKMLGLGDRTLKPVAHYYEKYLQLRDTKGMITLEELADTFKLILDNDFENMKKVNYLIKLLDRLLGSADLPMIELTDKELTLENTREWFALVDTIGALDDELQDFFKSTDIQGPIISNFISDLAKKTDVSAQAWEEHLRGLLVPGENLESYYRKRLDEFRESSSSSVEPVQQSAPVPLTVSYNDKTFKVLRIAEVKFSVDYFNSLIAVAEAKLTEFLSLTTNERFIRHGQNVKGVFRLELGNKGDGRAYFRFFGDEGYFVFLDVSATRDGHGKKGSLKNSYKERVLKPYGYEKEDASFDAFLNRIQRMRRTTEPVFKDPAMLAQDVGGIDLNSSALNLSVGGDARRLDQAFADAAVELDFDLDFIQGIYPVIHVVTPTPPFPLLLGLRE